MGGPQFGLRRSALPCRSTLVARTLQRRLRPATRLRAGRRKPRTLLVRERLLGRSALRLQHRRRLELGRRSNGDLRGSGSSRLVSSLQSEVRDLRSRRVSGRLTLATTLGKWPLNSARAAAPRVAHSPLATPPRKTAMHLPCVVTEPGHLTAFGYARAALAPLHGGDAECAQRFRTRLSTCPCLWRRDKYARPEKVSR